MPEPLVDSTLLETPFFGQGWPIYPALEEMCRVTGPALPGTNVYPAILQQFSPPLSFRDRVSVYVLEPNGIALGPGIYDCRLEGSYQGLPLYATTCCSTGSFSSSSSSGSR